MFYIALFSVPKDALQKTQNKKDTNEQYSTYMHTYKYSKNNNTEKDGTMRKREGEHFFVSGVVSDVEEMCFEMTFERLQ